LIFLFPLLLLLTPIFKPPTDSAKRSRLTPGEKAAREEERRRKVEEGARRRAEEVQCRDGICCF
jgi:hypothetical protein